MTAAAIGDRTTINQITILNIKFNANYKIGA
jgi:hypothetical protein